MKWTTYTREDIQENTSVSCYRYLQYTYSTALSPFLKERLFSKVIKKTLCLCCAIFMGKKTSFKINLTLDGIPTNMRACLLHLERHKVISSWKFGYLFTTKKELYFSKLDINHSLIDAKLQGELGNGIAKNLPTAVTKSIAELIERYSCCTWNSNDVMYRSPSELVETNDDFADPNNFISRKETYPKDLINNTTMGWIKATNLRQRSPILLPASLVFLGYNSTHPKEPHIFETTSSGAAAHRSLTRAVTKAILELIERHSFLYFWLTKKIPDKINLDEVKEYFPEVRGLLQAVTEAKHYEITLLDTAADVQIPAYTAVLINYKQQPAVAVTSTAGLNPAEEIPKVLCEVFKYADVSHNQNRDTKPVNDHVRTLDDRAKYWSNHSHIPKIKWFLSGNERSLHEHEKNNTHSQDDLSNILNTLIKNDYDTYVADVTTKLADRIGLKVVKAISPNLIPLYFDESYRPNNLGKVQKKITNLTPHPFL